MRESCLYGSVRGAVSNDRPYREHVRCSKKVEGGIESLWHGLWAPKRKPKEIVTKLNAAVSHRKEPSTAMATGHSAQMVRRLKDRRTQCRPWIRQKVDSGADLAWTMNHRCRNRGSAINSINEKSSHRPTMACIHQNAAIAKRVQRSRR